MTSEKLEYDSALGGSVKLSECISTYRYAGEHVKEIRDFLNNVRCPSSTKLMFQSLPKHMRRRAMSHHPKRLPRKYRTIHVSQMMKAGNPQQTKRSSRKYRRRPYNLMKEYIRRQRKYKWLETHIWHAKRFIMISRWGYKLPYTSCDKTYRACYRASARHCLLQDISFYGCIEIKGTINVIDAGFNHLTSSKCGLSITAKSYILGKREGSIDLFKADQYPKGALSKVSFIWKPCDDIQVNRTLWIFIHPSAYAEVLQELIAIFQVVNTEKMIKNKSAGLRISQYANEESGIHITELKDTMNRFRLTGDLSQSVLFHAFKCKLLGNDEPENWFKEYMQLDINKTAHKVQLEYWKMYSQANSPSVLIPNVILSLNIEDPRINRPQKRLTPTQIKIESNNRIYYELPYNLSHSVLWDINIREKITKSMMSEHEYCKNRNENALIPGERCKFENQLQPIPVLLIQRPGSQNNLYKRLGYGSGWDIILPTGYGMCVWLSLLLWGARAGGLKDLTSVHSESGKDEFLPDSVSGKIYYGERYSQLKQNYFLLPPNKRCNYNKLAICSPFRAPFTKLVKEWLSIKTIVNDIYVLRERDSLEALKNVLRKNSKFPNLPEECLIQISIKMITRGNPGEFSIVCLPKKNDLKRYYKQKYYQDVTPVYIEPLRIDENENDRKQIKINHKTFLKNITSKRVREKRKCKETSEKLLEVQSLQAKPLVAEHFKNMCELWLKGNPESVRYQCTREVFGYITECKFSFIEATVTGIGFVTANGLKKLVKVCKGIQDKVVLIRGTKSRNYRFADIKIDLMV